MSMDSGDDEIDKGNESSSSSSWQVSRSYSPISFYKVDSVVKYPGPIKKGNYVSLSSYNTTIVYEPGESKMDIFVSNEEIPHARRKYRQLWYYFYKDINVSHPGCYPYQRNSISIPAVPIINYHSIPIPPIARSHFSDSDSDSYPSDSEFDFDHSSSVFESKATFSCFGSSHSSQSKSESKVIFSCFGSSQSKSVAAAAPNISFGSFGCHSSELSKQQQVSSRNSSIPDKLAFSILSKLSIKSLKRFGLVRKSWSNLFENSHFMMMYSKHFISHHGSHHDYDTFIFVNRVAYSIAGQQLHLGEFYLLKNNQLQLNLSYPLQRSPYGTCILGSTSVNGIFCIGQPFPNLMPNSRYTLWNPLTDEFKEVPPSPAVLSPVDHEADVYLEHIFHGFGYDKLSDDFKVIHYVSFDDMFGGDSFGLPTSFFEIYSLKSNSWRMIHMDKDLRHRHYDFTHCGVFKGHEVYVDGACHWLVLGPIKEDLNLVTTGVSLLSFDLSDEVFITTPIGEELYSPLFRHHRLTVLNGSIALISNYHKDVDFHISILGELGVTESWIKLYTYGPLPCVHWPPIGFGKMGYMFVQKNDYEVVCVNLNTQIMEGFDIIAHRSFPIVGLYKESLRRIK